MMDVLEQQAPTVTAPRQAKDSKDAQAEAIAQRLAQFRETMAVIEAMPKRQRGTSPTPQEIRRIAYEEPEAA